MIRLRLFLLRLGNESTRRRCVKALSRSNDSRAQAALMAALSDKSFLVRKEAAQSLGNIGDARVIGPLINLVEDSFHYAMARTAVGALERVLDRVADAAVPEDILAAAILGDVNGIYHKHSEGTAWFSSARNGVSWTMDCSKVRTLANREVLRRGLAIQPQ